MSKHLYQDQKAEREANEVAARFMDSSDVVGDMSREFGYDFSSVKIHTDEAAAQRVEGTGVDAFASGKDIFFGRDVFSRQDPASKGLLAHELTHTMQQSGGEGVQQAAPAGAAQGGILDWFRGLFGRRRRPEISAPISVQPNTSPESVAYMNAVNNAQARAQRRANLNPDMTADQVQNRLPQAQIGQLGDAQTLENFRNVMGNSEKGVIQDSNKAFAGGTDVSARSNALVHLGIRTSGTEAAKANTAYRGSLLGGYKANVSEYMQNLENGGMNFTGVLNGTQKGTLKGSPGAYVSGGRIDQIEQDYLSMFGNYATSDEGIEYMKNTSDIVGQADVFGGDPRQAVNFMLQSMLNTTGAAYVGMDQDPNLLNGQDAMMVAREACRTLLMLPNLSQLGPDAMAALPAPIQTLVGQYNALLQNIQNRLGARG